MKHGNHKDSATAHGYGSKGTKSYMGGVPAASFSGAGAKVMNNGSKLDKGGDMAFRGKRSYGKKTKHMSY